MKLRKVSIGIGGIGSYTLIFMNMYDCFSFIFMDFYSHFCIAGL